jgi:hypothetical protein
VFKLPLLSWIGNAAAVLLGRHGAVTEQARHAACSRQTVYDHAARVQQALADAHLPGPDRAALLQENERLRLQNQQLWDWLAQALDATPQRCQQFAVQASTLGLSLSQTLLLLAVFVPPTQLPSRATLGRWVAAAGRRAGQLLAVLDAACRPLLSCLCLDEIFCRRRPVLMAVQPHSLAWVLGARAADRSGPTWARALAAWPALTDVAVDGGSGLARGLELTAAARREQAARTPQLAVLPLRSRLDVFHVRRDGARALRLEWAHAQAVWEQAEQCGRAKGRFDRAGGDRRHFKKDRVSKAWAKAEAAFERACARERAWQRAVAALGVWRADGTLNEAAWARAELQAAAAELSGAHWAKVVRQLRDERLLVFLERLHADLAAVAPNPQQRAALVALWCARRDGAAGPVGRWVVAVAKARLGPGEAAAYRQLGGVLRGVVRASSAVECVNSVVRMHQARHRHLSQGLLDLKRLAWNCRPFREGARRRRCPYELLGLKLPSYECWTLLQMDPAELQEKLSSSGLAA